jgi:hypothetical protein
VRLAPKATATGPLVLYCRAAGLPEPVCEHRFHPTRKWRFDYAWPEHLIAVEVEGGVFIQGRHSRGVGMLADMEKYNCAAVAGWRILRYTPKTLRQATVDVGWMLRPVRTPQEALAAVGIATGLGT